jgi:hypothetical protein
MKNRQLFKYYRQTVQTGKFSVAIALCMLCLHACKKVDEPAGVASLNIFNGIVGSSTLVTNFKGTEPLTWYITAHRLYYGNPGDEASINSIRNRFYSYSGQQRISFFEYPDTLAHSQPVTTVQVNLPVSSINSLFLTGNSDEPDTLFLRDELPYHGINDSTAGIRVVNLVKGLTVSVNLQGREAGSEVASLGYKAASGFINYEVKKAPVVYVFEIRDKLTGNLVASQTINTEERNIGFGLANLYRFKNFTIILFGDQHETGERAPRAVVMSNQ